MSTIQLPPFGLGARGARAPVALLGNVQRHGPIINNVYFQEILGPRTFGSVLNVGAGAVTAEFRQAEMFAANEYHTLEMPGSSVPATYHCLAENMDIVPSERYEWVISVAVFEHATDPWAVARETMRVTKPGGFIYVQAPFAFPLHYGEGYGDFWRFSPSGLTQLFPECPAARNRGLGRRSHPSERVRRARAETAFRYEQRRVRNVDRLSQR